MEDNSAKEDQDLLKRVFSGADINEDEHYQWKYNNNIVRAGFVSKVYKSEKLIARSGLIFQDANSGDVPVEIGLSCDSAVCPEHRDLHTFVSCMKNLINKAKELRLACIYGMPNNNSFLILDKILKFKRIFIYTPLIYFPPKILIKNEYLKSALLSVISFILHICSSILAFNINNKSYPISEAVDGIPPNLVCIDSSIIKTAKYLSWRYMKCPNRTYSIYSVSAEDGQTLGCIILRVKKYFGISFAFVVDVFWHEGGASTYSEVNCVIRQIANKLSIPVVYFSNQDLATKIMKQSGFFVMPRKFLNRDFHIYLLPLQEQYSSMLSDFKCSLGDIDVG